MNSRWLEDIPSAVDRDRLSRVLETPGAKLVGPAINVVIGLPPDLSVWQENMAVVFRARPFEVTKACLRLGQYIFRVYPRASDPTTCLVRAIVNDDLLRARATAAADLLRKYHRDAATMISTLIFKGGFSEPGESETVAWKLPESSPEIDETGLDTETFSWPDNPNTSWPQPMPSNVVQWLWMTAEARSTTPQDLITECVATAAWLDANFTSAPATLLEALLAKVVALDRLGQQLGQKLSAMETWSADWPQISERYYYGFSRYTASKERS